MKAFRIVVALVMTALFSLQFGSGAYAQDDDESDAGPPRGIPRTSALATVRKVVDGDTLRVTLDDGTKTTVRLLGVDAPDPNASDEAASCYGEEATERLEQLIKVGREIWLETDETDEEDGRLPRYVWVEKNDGSVYFLNEVMLRDGYAVFAPSEDDTKRAERLEKAERTAQAAGRGMWFECQEFLNPPTPTPEPQPAQPVDTYNVSGPASEAEKAYMRQVQDVIAQLVVPTYITSAIVNDPDFANDPALWFELSDTMQEYHSIWAQWQGVTVPTARLEAFHQSLTDALWNYDQAATKFEQGLNAIDGGLILDASNHISAAGDAFNRATQLLGEWENATGFDVSEDL